MKKTLSILLTIIQLLSLSACSDSLEAAEVIEVNTAQDSPSYVEGEDYQLRWNHWNSIEARKFTMSENGYYYYSSYGDLLLHFYDFATETDVIVCNQPNCDHTSPECNARLSGLGINIESIQYYEGNLYVIGVSAGIMQDIDVFRISADGSTRGKIGTILTMTQGDAASCAVHRGYVYCILKPDGSLNKSKLKLYRLSLSGDGEPEIVYTFDAAYGAGGTLKAYGNYVYIDYKYYTEKDGDAATGDYFRYNIHTGETELVLAGHRADFSVDDTYLYYSDANQTLTYDLESGETTVLLNRGLMFFMIDGDYLYCDNGLYVRSLPKVDGSYDYDKRVITVIDRNTFETVATIPLTFGGSYFIGACGTRMFAYYDYGFYACDLNTALSGEEAIWEELN